MRILILQLARFGDVFITWSTIRALRRRYPEAEIHLLVRERFHQAAEGCEAVDHLWCLDTAHILEPLVTNSGDVDVSLVRLSEWLEILSENDFDFVLNLSFSPFSSYLASLLSNGNAHVKGYTRQSDGFLAIPDDASAYFYAQVGVGRSNRYHLSEIFAAVADVEITSEDFRPSASWAIAERLQNWKQLEPALQNEYLVLHLGASQSEKVYPAFKWHRVVLELQRKWKGQIVLVGSEAENSLAQQMLDGGGCNQVINLLGRTDFADVVALIEGARLLVGGDSAPMHLASFTHTPCLNLSFSFVNFWETGPRTNQSHILVADSPADLASDRVAKEILSMLSGTPSDQPVVIRNCQGRSVEYEWSKKEDPAFEWHLIQAIYSGGAWPKVEDLPTARGLWQMREVVQVATQQMTLLTQPKKQKNSSQLIEQSDLAIRAIGQVVPSLRPLVNWFETEKLRIPPGSLEDLIERSGEIYGQLLSVLHLYFPLEQSTEVQP